MRRIVLSATGTLLVASLLLVACAPAALPAAPSPTPKEAAAAPTPAVTGTAVPTPTPTSMATMTKTPAPVKPTPVTAPEPAVEKPKYGGVLRILGRTDLAFYDVQQTNTYLDLLALSPMYNLLIQSDPKDINRLVPDLAERWEASADGKVYTFHLRKGVKFHDGTPLSSADVKANFERLVWPPKGVINRRQAYLDAVDKIETPDDRTVKFVLKRPQAAFPVVVATPFFVVFPKALLDRKRDMKQEDIIGSGPFRFKEYMRGVQFVVEKNPDYFIPGRPYLDGIARYIIPDLAAARGAFIAGQLDLLQPDLPYTKAELEVWKKLTPDMVIPQTVGAILYAFSFNNEKKGPWNDRRVRQAVMLALDEDALLERHKPFGVRGGFMLPGPWAIPTEELLKLPGWGKTTAEDLAEAKRLLAEAGYPKGFSARFLERPVLKEYADMAVSYKGMLAKVGIDLEFDFVESGVYLVRRYSLDWETQGESPIPVEIGEPDIVFSRVLSTSSGNVSRYRNPRIDELYREQSQSLDVAERKKKVLEIQRIMMEDLPFVPSMWQGLYAIHSPQVKGYYRSGGNYVRETMEEVWLAR